MDNGLYYDENWCKFHEKIDGGTYRKFSFENEHGKIEYPMTIRPINKLIDGARYFDIVTPKGYSGPTMEVCKSGHKSDLLEAYMGAFMRFCEENLIVSEYVRFNPWNKNYEDFGNYYDVSSNGIVFGIRLDTEDFFFDEITSKTRNVIRKAEKIGVEILFDEKFERLNEFLKLYEFTAEKNKISEYYKLDLSHLQAYIEMLKGSIFKIDAIIGGSNLISSALFIIKDDIITYNYSATNPEYFSTGAVSKIIYEACKIGKSKNCKLMDMGGANNENLRTFKRGFSRMHTEFTSYVGKAIRNKKIYDKLIEGKEFENKDYFPLYRG